MFLISSSKKYIYIYTLVILICQAHGNGSYLNGRNGDYRMQRNTQNDKLGKGNRDGQTTSEHNDLVADESSVQSSVGEVFVPKTFSLSSQEPSCEQLRAMWIFSKRQSRAAEITNEIPTYHDPFTYNVWEPLYSNSRLFGSLRMGSRDRAGSPVFGRVVSREPIIPQRIGGGLEQRQRLIVDGSIFNPGQTRIYSSEARPITTVSAVSQPSSSFPPSSSLTHRTSKNRYMGVPYNSGDNLRDSQNSAAVQGSFQKLKELIWTERAKELTQQRRTEELAARAAVLKEIANGQNLQGLYKTPFNEFADSLLMDENRSPDSSSSQYAPANRLSISNGQSFDSKNSNNKNAGYRIGAGSRASTRRIGSNFGEGNHATEPRHREADFSRKSNQANAISRTAIPTTDSNLGEYLSDHTVMGIPRTYPIRQSHFRERNRSLFKQTTHGDGYFHRENRKLISEEKFAPLKTNLNENYLTPSKSIEYGIMKPRFRFFLYSDDDNDQANDNLKIKNNEFDSFGYN